MKSDPPWRDAYGQLKLPFLKATGQILDGDFHVACPNCVTHTLRFYYHVFNHAKSTGTIWSWCPQCRLTAHLPRVDSEKWQFPDPYQNVSLDAFADMETASDQPFLSRLDALWDQGKIGLPTPVTAEAREQTHPSRRRR